jgi:hypothetical protein
MSTICARGNIKSIMAVQVVFDPASVATATTAEQDVTVPGVAVGDIVLCVNKPSLTTGVGIVNARVKAANTVSLQFVNPTAGAVNPSSETYTVVIGKLDSALALSA